MNTTLIGLSQTLSSPDLKWRKIGEGVGILLDIGNARRASAVCPVGWNDGWKISPDSGCKSQKGNLTSIASLCTQGFAPWFEVCCQLAIGMGCNYTLNAS